MKMNYKMSKQAKYQKDPSGNIEWINGKHPILTAKAYKGARNETDTTPKTYICPNCDEGQGYRVCKITNRDIAELIDAQTKLLLNPRDGGIFGSPNRIRYNNALAKLRSKTDINEHKKPKGEKNDIQSD